MIPGETILSGAPDRCDACGKALVLKVWVSPAGWYIGTACYCGPYSRESDYFPTEGQAQAALECWRQGDRVGARL